MFMASDPVAFTQRNASGQNTTAPWAHKKCKMTHLNDYNAVVVISTTMKCFERLVMAYISSNFEDNLDSLQFVYSKNVPIPLLWTWCNPLARHSAQDHLAIKNIYIRLLFIDCHSAFSSITPNKFISRRLDFSFHLQLAFEHQDWQTRVEWNFLHSDPSASQICILSPPVSYTLQPHWFLETQNFVKHCT